jgi:hypothetical protein
MQTWLSNIASTLTLRGPDGQIVDQVQWERPPAWPLDAPTGKSIYRTAAEDHDTAADWSVANSAPRGGTQL